MTRRTDQIGFSQRVHLQWLEQTANLVLAGNDKAAVNDALQELLKDKVSVSGQAERGNREKIITILLKVWLKPPNGLETLREDGLELLKRVPQGDHLAIHWGMVMAVYPFWAEVAGHVGRLLKIQGSVAASQIQRRIREQYGERETVARATRRIIRSSLDWGVIQEGKTKGHYCQGRKVDISDMSLATWLIEAILFARPSRRGTIKELTESPSLFPFTLHVNLFNNSVKTNHRLEIVRQGLDDTLLVLKQESGEGTG